MSHTKRSDFSTIDPTLDHVTMRGLTEAGVSVEPMVEQIAGVRGGVHEHLDNLSEQSPETEARAEIERLVNEFERNFGKGPIQEQFRDAAFSILFDFSKLYLSKRIEVACHMDCERERISGAITLGLAPTASWEVIRFLQRKRFVTELGDRRYISNVRKELNLADDATINEIVNRKIDKPFARKAHELGLKDGYTATDLENAIKHNTIAMHKEEARKLGLNPNTVTWGELQVEKSKK